jgi:phosphoglycerate dehydrogenase-like enzyme
MPQALVTFDPPHDVRRGFEAGLDGAADVVYLPDRGANERVAALESADAVLAWHLGRELEGAEEFEQLRSAGLVQLLSAGVDHVPFDRLARDVPVASNAGAYAPQMAEHVLALALALAKRLVANHAAMARGEFNQETPTLSIRDSVVGILGFGGIGQASAKLFKALGARIHAINRSQKASELVDWMGTLDDLDTVLRAADILVLSLPLTRTTRELIGQRELALMKPTAILINVARAGIVEERALYEHLRANPAFSAGLDTWWQEPLEGGSFTTREPFFELPNLLGSPHNSGMTADSLAVAARRAAENVSRFLRGEEPENLVDPSDYVGRS